MTLAELRYVRVRECCTLRLSTSCLRQVINTMNRTAMGFAASQPPEHRTCSTLNVTIFGYSAKGSSSAETRQLNFLSSERDKQPPTYLSRASVRPSIGEKSNEPLLPSFLPAYFRTRCLDRSPVLFMFAICFVLPRLVEDGQALYGGCTKTKEGRQSEDTEINLQNEYRFTDGRTLRSILRVAFTSGGARGRRPAVHVRPDGRVARDGNAGQDHCLEEEIKDWVSPIHDLACYDLLAYDRISSALSYICISPIIGRSIDRSMRRG